MNIDLDALEQTAREAGDESALALIAEIRRLKVFHDHEKGRADEVEAERDALQERLDKVRELAQADYRCPCCTGYESILEAIGEADE